MTAPHQFRRWEIGDGTWPRSSICHLRSSAQLLLLACVVACLALPFAAMAEDQKTSDEDQINWTKEKQFWSFQPPMAQARPAVKNKRWPSQRLDYFILARLEQKNLSPSMEADRRTLIRRVTFDLTGLPP